jgi:hypothetical protein
VWDQHDRPPAHLRGHRRGRDALTSDLFARRLKDSFGDREFVSLGPYLRQLLGQPFFEFVQFRTSRGDPFQQLQVGGGSVTASSGTVPGRKWRRGCAKLSSYAKQAPSMASW